MNKKYIFFGIVYLVLTVVIIVILNKTISDVNHNQKGIFNEYFSIKEITDLYPSELNKCDEINAVLTKDLKDNKIKKYEQLELNYYFKKDKDCVNQINNFYKTFFKKKRTLKFKYSKQREKILRHNIKIRKILNKTINRNKKGK